jgi:hypothetical protein
MLGSEILDVAVGLGLVYLLLSIVCTALNELIAQALGWRAKTLQRGIASMLRDPRLTERFYAHPLIRSMAKGRNGKPSYIPSGSFALVLTELLREEPRTDREETQPDAEGSTVRPLAREEIEQIQDNPELKSLLATLLTGVDGDARRVQERVEAWFDDVMERVSGWYKRRTQAIILIIAVIVTVGINVDTILIADTLARSEALREAMVARATGVGEERGATEPQEETQGETTPERQQTPLEGAGASTQDTDTPSERLRASTQDLFGLGLPIGWVRDANAPRKDWWDLHGSPSWPAGEGILVKLIGLLLTAIAVSLGAPFWFDVLNKFVHVRGAGRSPVERAKPPEAPNRLELTVMSAAAPDEPTEAEARGGQP